MSEYLAEVEVQWLDELETAGTQINYPDKAPFVDAMSSVYNQFVGDGDDMVSPELLEQVREIIGFCVEIRLFNQELFALQGILTSFGIQSRYREINKRSISRISPEWEIREETAPTSTVEISVPVTETPVLATETAPKGKGG